MNEPYLPHGMDLHYQSIYKQAQELQTSFHARLQDPFNPMAVMLRREADDLVSDIAGNKHPRDVEDRIHGIQSRLRRARDQSDTTIMSYENNDFMQRRYGSIRDEIQRLPHYNQPREIPQHRDRNQWV